MKLCILIVTPFPQRVSLLSVQHTLSNLLLISLLTGAFEELTARIVNYDLKRPNSLHGINDFIHTCPFAQRMASTSNEKVTNFGNFSLFSIAQLFIHNTMIENQTDRDCFDP